MGFTRHVTRCGLAGHMPGAANLIGLSDHVTAVPDSQLLVNTSSEACLVQSVATQDRQSGVLEVMLVGDPCSDAVPKVLRSAGLFCLSCSAQRMCRHVTAAQGDQQNANACNKAQQLACQQRFQNAFDGGRRRITTLSQARSVARCTCVLGMN